MAKDTMGLESEQVCPAAQMLRDIMANQQTVESDPYLYLDPHPRVRSQRIHGLSLFRFHVPLCILSSGPILVLQTGARASSVVRQHKPFDNAVVFAIGGGNYVEYEQVLRLVSKPLLNSLHCHIHKHCSWWFAPQHSTVGSCLTTVRCRLARQGTDRRHIVYGATDIVSPREFLSQLQGLGKRS